MELLLTTTVRPDGTATIEVRTDPRQVWSVQQVSPEMVGGAPGPATGQIRKNGALVAPFEPSADAMAGEPYPKLVLGDVLTVEWTNCEPGAVARALVMYEVIAP
jgi:hypothetical protein